MTYLLLIKEPRIIKLSSIRATVSEVVSPGGKMRGNVRLCIAFNVQPHHLVKIRSRQKQNKCNLLNV